MTDTLEVELEQLVQVATETLPDAAEHLRDAAKEAHRVGGMSFSGYRGELLDAVRQPWAEAEDLLLEALARGSGSLADAATGLVEIAKRYGYDELSASDLLDHLGDLDDYELG